MTKAKTLVVTTPSDREIVLTRTFDAPRNLVFEAWTRPELLKLWFGPQGSSLVVCDIDLKPGGRYRLVLRGPDGADFAIRGEYREIVLPERLVYTQSFDDWREGESIVTMVLVEDAKRTSMTITVLHPSREYRDAMIRGDMEHGAIESYDRLAELLVSLS
jgi:uncharacterized protein YndB with AHSA1/START domain